MVADFRAVHRKSIASAAARVQHGVSDRHDKIERRSAKKKFHVKHGSDMIRVVAALIDNRGKLLICQRRRGDPFELQWEFPGGKIRGGETPRAALARELREELGVRARIGREIFRTRYNYAQPNRNVEITFFAAIQPFPTPRNIVFERILWARPPDLCRYDFLAADRRLVASLVRGELSVRTLAETLRLKSSGRRPPQGSAR